MVADEPDPPVHAGPLWPVISGLLRKNPGARLTASETEHLLHHVAAPPARADQAPADPAPEEPARAEDAPTGPSMIVGSFQRISPKTPRDHDHRRRWAALAGVAGLVVLALGATGVALALTGSPGHQMASPPASTRPGTSSSPHPSAPTATRTTGNTGTVGNTRNGGNAGTGAPPAGWYRFTNSTGFSIGVPEGWQISHVGHYVYITDPDNGGIFLLIDQSDQPKANPLADWEQQQANRESSYPDYHLIRLESVDYPQAEKAADWEFTYVRKGVLVHILDGNVLANAHHAYALYWSTPEVDWNSYYRYFQAFAATFRPAPP